MYRGIVAAVVLALIGTGPISATPIPWPVSSGGNGHSYEPVGVPGTNISWTTARDAAVAKDGYLACITSAAENAFVFNVVNNDAYWSQRPGWSITYGPWLGGYQYDRSAEPAGHWAWISGEPWTYTNWASNEPSNEAGIEEYLHYFSYSNTYTPAATWNDQFLQSYWPVSSYVIEYNRIVPEPSTVVLFFTGALGLAGWAWKRKRTA